MGDPLLEKLKGRDRRSIGRANDVVAQVLLSPHLFANLFAGLHAADPIIRMRSADALEKLTARHPEWLAPYKDDLLLQLAAAEQREVRWHLIQMAPRLPLTEGERADTVALLRGYLSDTSSIVKTSAMQALADLVGANGPSRAATIRLIEQLVQVGTPAMRSRGRKLLRNLHAESPRPIGRPKRALASSR
jgi:hypothetical protein